MSHTPSYSRNTDRASLDFLNRFSEPEMEKGTQLQENGHISQIFGDHLVIRGRVESGGAICRTTLRLRGNRWEGECSCGKKNCPSLYAVMLEKTQRNGEIPESPNEINEKPIAELLERQLGRELNDREERYLGVLEKRYRRFETEGAVSDHDIMRLHRKWEVKSYDALELWPSPPTDIIEFWNYIAYAFSGRGLDYPPFLKGITDIDATAEKLNEWESERRIEQWHERIKPTGYRVVPKTSRVLRMLVTTAEARMQEADVSEGADFADIDDGRQYQALADADDAGALELDAASMALWKAYQDWWNENDTLVIRLDQPGAAEWLNRVFLQPLLYGRIVTLDEQPFTWVDEPLLWRCQEPTGESNDNYRLEFWLGEMPAPSSFRVLPGGSTLYLTDEALCRGPAHWLDSTTVEPTYEIPTPVLHSTEGVAFLHRIQATLPPALADRVVLKPLAVTIRTWLETTGRDSEMGYLQCEAADDEVLCKERYRQGDWELIKAPPADSAKILHFDRDKLEGIPDVVDSIVSSWDVNKEAYRLRLTSTFPERFLEWAEELPGHIRLECDDSLKSLLGPPVKADISVSVEESGQDWFDVQVQVKARGGKVAQTDIDALVRARGKFVRLKNGKWMRLGLDFDDEARKAMEDIGLDPFDTSGETHRMHVLQLSSPATSALLRKKDWEQIRDRAGEIKLNIKPKTARELLLKLRPYQVEGFHFLAYLATNRFGGILADDMGLGKTVQCLAWMLWLRNKETAKGETPAPSLVVCPKSVIDVWDAEVKKACPDLPCTVVRNKTEFDAKATEESGGILILNYAQLRILVEELQEIPWLAVVLDEGQQIKNPDSQAARAARALKSGHRLVLTGTPLENRLLDIWSLMDFAMPGVLGDRRYFKKRFDRRKDPACQPRLAARLRPFLLRRSKNQVALDLPPRTEEDILCRMEDGQAELYDTELTRIREHLLGFKSDSELRRNQFVVLQGLMRLRQICCHPSLVMENGEDMPSAKLEALFYLLNQLQDEGHKSLVFSQFTSMLDIIRQRMEKEERPYQLLTGRTRNRAEVIDRFQHNKLPSTFLLSLKAGGTGLNLTAASYVVLYDPWWNPAVENQAIDRTHRIGQTNHVIAYRLIMRDTVEEKIRKMQRDKSAMAEGVLGDEGFASNLKREDVEYLFSTDGN